ncbi:MAG: hypothetical protein PUG34_02275 [Eubacteriales bacterium]|nr:hypothetical protein [Eubacteriales bacterium]
MIPENEIRKLLNSSGIKAYMERPENVPDEYCIVERTGSTSRNWITTCTIAVQSIAPRLADAAALNDHMKRILLQAEIDGITSIKLVSDYNFTNMAAKQYRYQAVFSVVSKEI